MLNPESSSSPRFGPVLWLLRATTLLWAGAWSAFAIAGAIGGEWRGYLIAIGFGACVWAPALLAWRWPRVGGAAMAALGVWSWGFFESRSAMVGLSIPAVFFGTAWVLSGIGGAWRRARARRRARRS